MKKILIGWLISVAMFGVGPAAAEALTREQGAAILEELKQIRLLLEKQQRPVAAQAPAPAPAPAVPAAAEKVSLKLGQEIALGKADAPVTVIEFNDLQCPFCNRFHAATFGEIRKNYIDTGKVRFINRDLPLEDLHPQAVRASHAARCAGDQGKYWEAVDRLITRQAGMSPQTIDKNVTELGVEPVAYRACMDSNRHMEAIRESGASARALGVSGTPTFLIGRMEGNVFTGQKLVGAVPYASFENAIKAALGSR